MSTAAPAAAAAAAPAAPAAAEKKSISAEIRARVLSGGRPVTAKDESPQSIAAKAKVDKEAADKKTADEKAAADKAAADNKKADEAAAAAANGGKPKARKVKDGPALPAAPAAETEAQMRARIERETREKEAQRPAPPTNPEADREIELARFAETKHPDKYAGFAAKVSGYFTARDQLFAEKAKALGGPYAPEFKDWLDGEEFKQWNDQHRPSYQRGDKAKLAEDIIADRARAEATREMQPKLKEMERKTAELEHGPEIKARANQFLQHIITDPNEVKDAALEGFAKDPIKFGEDHPEEAQLIAADAADAVELITEVYRIDRDLVEFNPKARPVQQRIREFMVRQNATMREKHPSGIEMPDGKILIDAATFEQRGLDKDPRYRVFAADEIAGMIAATRNAEILAKLERRRVGVQKSVYAPKAPAAPVVASGKAKEDDDDPPSPGAVASSAPGSPGKAAKVDKPWKKYI